MSATEKEHNDLINSQIYNERISLLYVKSVVRPLFHIISLVIFLMLIINHVNVIHAYIWALILIGLNVYRIIDINKTQKDIAELEDFKIIHYRFAFSICMLGAIYGLGVVYFINDLPKINQIYLSLLIPLLIPAGLISFSSDKLTFNLYIYPLILPVIVWFFCQGSADYFYIGLVSIFYLCTVKKYFLWNYEALIDSIRLKFENAGLLNELQELNGRLRALSEIDELTQISNRRGMNQTLEKEWLRAKRLKSPISIFIIDIDNFKQYNDEFGHIKGDECLACIANFMKDNLNRPTDFIARYGGEEFSIIMPDTNSDGAINLAERLLSGIRDLKISNPSSKVSKYLTISIGIASVVPDTNDNYMDFVYSSDKALYKAKADGKNMFRITETLERNLNSHLML